MEIFFIIFLCIFIKFMGKDLFFGDILWFGCFEEYDEILGFVLR